MLYSTIADSNIVSAMLGPFMCFGLPVIGLVALYFTYKLKSHAIWFWILLIVSCACFLLIGMVTSGIISNIIYGITICYVGFIRKFEYTPYVIIVFEVIILISDLAFVEHERRKAVNFSFKLLGGVIIAVILIDQLILFKTTLQNLVCPDVWPDTPQVCISANSSVGCYSYTMKNGLGSEEPLVKWCEGFYKVAMSKKSDGTYKFPEVTKLNQSEIAIEAIADGYVIPQKVSFVDQNGIVHSSIANKDAGLLCINPQDGGLYTHVAQNP